MSLKRSRVITPLEMTKNGTSTPTVAMEIKHQERIVHCCGLVANECVKCLR